MKRLWVAAGMIAAVVALCVTVVLYQHRQIDKMLVQLDRLEQVYDSGDRDAARSIAQDMATDYKAVGRVLFCFVTHNEMADSQETVALLPDLVMQQGEEELRMEIARLREQLTYLRGIDDLRWENVL